MRYKVNIARFKIKYNKINNFLLEILNTDTI